MIKLLFFVSYPIARILDNCLGVQGKTRFSKEEIKDLLKLHVAKKIKNNNKGLTKHEVIFFNFL